ncbi:hypothetical protein PENSPDRAFT_654420 [Peniophora sp. CONT]|nr:hypothetical protein PENSPDRAFT_654420 [Peniophora sp. CONT]
MLGKYSWPLLYVAALHLIGIYLFTRGFLLSRLSLPNISSCPNQNCTLYPTHKRAIVLIIDALRFDFITPNPPVPTSPYHHDVLSLPRELSATEPRNSFIYNAYADPPTTTLQRIKGLVTGSLPTFVDMGHNFGGASIDEDSLVKQFIQANRTVAFMGDDTWLTVFPDSFHPNMSHPFDSFNVEDLHSVDNGVKSHLFPLLSKNKKKSWDLLIGHFLGVDHVGHRLGPDHPEMRLKLKEMNEVLGKVVQEMEKDTLLVVLGDHGMDRRGDHGGDGELETSSGLWIYSKTPLSVRASYVVPEAQTGKTFPGAPAPSRSIQQIDILPTLSLLLGLPIPFNNLGTVIPEVFWRDRDGADYVDALSLNAAQIHRYLTAYRDSSAGSELDNVWAELQAAWALASEEPVPRKKLANQLAYTRLALETCRSLWAQFNILLILLGMGVLALSLAVGWTLYGAAGRSQKYYDLASEGVPVRLGAGAAAGAIACLAPWALGTLPGVSLIQHILFGLASGSAFTLFGVLRPTVHLSWALIPLLLHPLSFLSNSFILWEDRALPFLLVTSLLPSIAAALSAPRAYLRKRILFFCGVFALCVRLMSVSTVCREEQHPWCTVTFFSGASIAEPPRIAAILALPIALGLPYLLRTFLTKAKANNGIADFILPYALPAALTAGTMHWLLEWADSAALLSEGLDLPLRTIRTVLAQGTMYILLVGCGTLWMLFPSTLLITSEKVPAPESTNQTEDQHEHGKTKVIILGFANALGAPYLIMFTLVFGMIWLCTQLTGQLTLALSVVALLSYLELTDSVRDARALQEAFESDPARALELLQSAPGTTPVPPRVHFSEIVPIALLGQLAFFSTGHQAVLSTIQWKAAFVLVRVVRYPWAPLTVALNTFGPLFLFAFAAPLLALWNAPPLDTAASPPKNNIPAARQGALRAGLGVMCYFGALVVGSAVSAAALRRHLMVWKVFAPRFMLGAVGVGVVDVGVVLGALACARVGGKVGGMFGVK